MQIIERLRERLKQKDVSVLKLSKEIGISPYKIYKWLDGKSQPKYEDKALIEKWLSDGLENVPHETSQISGTAHGTSKVEGDLKDKLIASKEETIAELRERIKELSAKKEVEINWNASLENIEEIRKKLLELPQQLVSGVVDGIVTRVYPSKAEKKGT